MSIVLAADAERMSVWVMGALLVISMITVGGAAMIGAFRPRVPETLRRLFGPEPVLPIVFNGIAAAMVFFVGQMIAFAVIVGINGGFKTDPKELLTGSNLVILAIAMHLAAFSAMIVGLGFVVRNGFGRVGLKRSPVMGGVIGLGLIAAALPVLLLVMGATEWIYYLIGYKHEDAHQLLQAMDPDNPLIRIAAVFAAVVVAPLSEELFFRGHVQHLLRRLFAKLFVGPAYLPVAAPVDPIQQPTHAPPYLSPLPAAPPPPPPGHAPLAAPVAVLPMGYYSTEPAVPVKTFWPSALAVVSTSLAFTVVHPVWSWPPIFVLAIALGFAYERTGNLWVTITMHAVFNGLMTAMYLLLQTGQGS